MTACDVNARAISDYVDNTLTVDQRIIIERHITSCHLCRTIEHDFRATRRLLHSLPNASVSAGFDSRLASRLADLRLRPVPWYAGWLHFPAALSNARTKTFYIAAVTTVFVAGFALITMHRDADVTIVSGLNESDVLSELSQQHQAATASQSVGDTASIVLATFTASNSSGDR